ncbi:MAG TPA: VOC family protein [Acidimicrobiia bacterium]|nr:VOC family protein [Acidimicrobiia bacterium]
MSGRIVHFEIPADDVERAQAFYQGVFGWELQPLPEAGYTLATTGPSGEQGPTEIGFINGGMLARGTGGVEHPVVTIDVDDIDAALARIEEAGGKTVSGRTDVLGMGWSAYFMDPEGNLTGLWQNAPT